MKVVETEMNEKQGLKIGITKKRDRTNHPPLEENYDDKPIVEEGQIEAPQTQEKKTLLIRPRPKLSPDLLQGPIMKTTSNAPRIEQFQLNADCTPWSIHARDAPINRGPMDTRSEVH